MLPEGWKETNIAAVIDGSIKNGYSPNPVENVTGFYVLSLGALGEDTSNFAEYKNIADEPHIHDFILKYGDFLISRSNTPDKVGRSGLYLGKDSNIIYPDLMMKFRANEDLVDKIFFSYYLKFSKTRTYFQQHAAGSSKSMVKINKNTVLSTPILLPPLAEQKKIAEILSTWDEAISVVDKQLENCRQQKKALMQQLLTGKNRLPGFSGEWKFLPIKQIAQRIQRASDGEAHPVLTISSLSRFVRQEDKYARDMAGKSIERYILLQKGEFAYNKGNSKTYPCGCVFDLYEYESGLVPNIYVCFKLNEGNSLEFYRYVFEFDCIRFQLENLINTGVRNNGLLNIKPEDFMNVKVPVPSIEEQKTLADIFMKQDEIIRILSKKLATLQEEKKSLMQQLLTGKKRVAV